MVKYAIIPYTTTFCTSVITFFMFSKASHVLWDKLCEKKLGYAEIALVWIMPVLIWIPVWLDETQFGTGNGNENGYTCYPKQDGKLVLTTNLEKRYLLATDILVMLTIAIFGCIVVWSLKTEMKEAKEEIPEETLEKYKPIIDRMRRKANYSTGALILSYVVLRLPWMIFSEISGNDINSIGMKTSILLYWMKFNILFLIFGFARKNYRNAFKDLIKLLCPCCLCKQQTIKDQKLIIDIN